MKIKTVLSCVFALLVILLLLLSFKKTARARTTPPATFDVRQENIPHGIVIVADYNSTTVGAKQRMLIYTPPDYTSARQYPVLYLLHGAGDGEDAWTSSGLADVILDNLYHSKQILPMLVVMPRGRVSADPRPRLAPAQEIQAWAALEDELLKDIIPYVDSHFSVRPEPASRALAGLSMGGGQSLNIGLKHPETFSWVAAFSSAPNTRPLSELVTASNQLQNVRLLWLSCGEHDQLLKLNQSFHDALAKQNVTHIWKLGPGSHEWPVWKSDLYFLSQKLFQPPGTN